MLKSIHNNFPTYFFSNSHLNLCTSVWFYPSCPCHLGWLTEDLCHAGVVPVGDGHDLLALRGVHGHGALQQSPHGHVGGNRRGGVCRLIRGVFIAVDSELESSTPGGGEPGSVPATRRWQQAAGLE